MTPFASRVLASRLESRSLVATAEAAADWEDGLDPFGRTGSGPCAPHRSSVQGEGPFGGAGGSVVVGFDDGDGAGGVVIAAGAAEQSGSRSRKRLVVIRG